jgi:EmrB/QacA subfamily drug resistance transporter
MRRRLLWAAILASAMGFIDGSVLAIAIPAIREGLSASLAQAQWVSNAYLVTLSALILAGGALGDRFGTARVFALGITAFVAASLICAVAPSANLLIVARAVQGAAAALMVPGSLALIARAYPRDERGRAIGVWAAASALTTSAGPLLGGLLLSWDSPGVWRWIFAVNLPLGILALWLMRDGLRSDAGRPDHPVDLPGAALATLGLGLLAAGLTREDGGATALSLGGGAALLSFVAWEAWTPHPMMPLGLFRDRAFAVANLATFTLYAALSAVLFFLPMLLVAGWGLSEFQTSFAFAPLSLAIFLLSSRFGAMADRAGPGRLIGGGAALVALSYGWLALTVGAQAFWTGVLPPMILAGVGMAMLVAPLSAAVMAAVGEDDSGAASGINNAVSRVAGLVAVAALGGVVAGVYADWGGPLSYGETGSASVHAVAMTRAFAAVAWIAALLAAISAALAFLGIPHAHPGESQTNVLR